jgi:DNA invertase Pin-like site-specific DNA recombinase
MATRRRSGSPDSPAGAGPPVAVGLVRCSSQKQEHSTSDQRTEIRGWCEESGHELLEVFEDEAVSGSDLGRPGLTALLEYVETHSKQGVVVAWTRNRLARPDDPRDGLLLERRIEKAGWKLHYLRGAQATGNALADTLMGVIEHHQSGEFLRSLASDTLRGQFRRALEGKKVFGQTPFGFACEVTWPNGTTQVIPRTDRRRTKDATTARLVPGDPVEVEIVKGLYECYASGEVGLSTLASEIGEPSPTGKGWSAAALSTLIRNPVYCGDFAWNRRTAGKFMRLAGGRARRKVEGRPGENDRTEWIVIPDHHEPLVSRETWERANRILEERGKRVGGRRRVRTPYGLTGLVYCGVCGRRMAGSRSKGRERYVCTSFNQNHSCQPYQIRAARLEGAILGKLRDAYLPLLKRKKLRDRVLKVVRHQLGSKQPPRSTRRLERERADLEKKIDRALENMGKVGTGVARRVAAKIEQWTDRQREIDEELVRIQAHLAREVDLDRAADEIVGLLGSLEEVGAESPPEQRRRLFQGTVERVELGFETDEPPGGGGGRRRHRFTGGRVDVTPALAALECMATNTRTPD